MGTTGRPYEGGELDDLRRHQRELLLAIDPELVGAAAADLERDLAGATTVERRDLLLVELEARRHLQRILKGHRAADLAEALQERHAAELHRRVVTETLAARDRYADLVGDAQVRVTNARGTVTAALGRQDSGRTLDVLIGALLLAEVTATDAWDHEPVTAVRARYQGRSAPV